MSTHFVKTAAEIETLKATLPAGVTELVDKSGVHGSLTYPDRPFYSFVAAMEYCYAEMATPENLGGVDGRGNAFGIREYCGEGS